MDYQLGADALWGEHNAFKPAPTLYSLASADYGNPNLYCNSSGTTVPSTCVFYDITQGETVVPCTPGSKYCYVNPNYPSYGVLTQDKKGVNNVPAYNATVGWDFASGIGSVNVSNLLTAWPAN